MRRFRVLVRPHNTLLTLARYQVEVVRAKSDSGDHGGIGLDCIAAVISMAFAAEALINFVGEVKVTKWKESQRYPKKVAALEAALQISMDRTTEPFTTRRSPHPSRSSS